VLVNNAGIGLVGAFEETPRATTREVLETNTFGVMEMTQAVLPRLSRAEVRRVVNVTSSVTLTPMPLAAVSTASKMAIEGFTASLALELDFFDVGIKLVEPGSPLPPHAVGFVTSTMRKRACPCIIRAYASAARSRGAVSIIGRIFSRTLKASVSSLSMAVPVSVP
jgi:NAD(P)-dependent dehydrogenase (short-subunit alcohol dehydrogenase family)